MKVTLKNITPFSADFIGEMAAICYDGPVEYQSNIKRAKKCKEDSHFATMRFAHATFHVGGFSRCGSEQMLRHKFLDFLKRSQRYCDDGDALVVVPPSIAEKPDLLEAFMAHARQASTLYKFLTLRGIKKEDARYALLLATESEFNVVGSLQAWHDFLYGNAGRLQKAAQWEIKAVAREIERQLAEAAPELFTCSALGH